MLVTAVVVARSRPPTLCPNNKSVDDLGPVYRRGERRINQFNQWLEAGRATFGGATAFLINRC
jgi:hypothetical protein